MESWARVQPMDIQLGQWVVWDGYHGPGTLTRIVVSEPGAEIRWAVEDPDGAWRVADAVGVDLAAGLPPDTRGCWVRDRRIRPATQEEIAKVQLTQLEGL